ncbi:SCO family protein, partial [Salmonella enterica subsp. enterica serovar Typhi]|nr:SCO family protein [Salmonella enterica subsp. enterica serovar Typhi]
GKDLRAYFISIDPERDTPEITGRYVGNVSKRITAISGEPDKVLQMAKDFKIYYRKVPTDDGSYTMDHTASILLLKSNGDFFGTIAYEENSETALAKLKRLASEG